MKIIFILTQAFDPFAGGVQMTTFKLSKKFTEMGYESIVYSFNNSGNVEPKFTRLCYSENENLHHNKENRDHFYNFVKNERPDFVISQVPYEDKINEVVRQLKDELNFIALSCLRNSLFSVKLNIDLYIKNSVPVPLYKLLQNPLGRSIFQKLHKSKHAKSLKSILDIYDRFIMFGEPNKREIQYFIGNYKQEKLAYIPNSIPHVEKELPEKQNRILWLSRLNYNQKQAHLILPIWKKIYNLLPEWELDVVGDGEAFKDLAKQIEKDEIPRITLHGKQKPDSYYRKSPIYVMTSANEGFPNTILEAQSFGCVPIVFDSYPIAAWVINDNKNGLLVKFNDIESMVDKIVQTASHSVNMKTMGNNALKNAERFQVDKVGVIWRDLFHQLMKS